MSRPTGVNCVTVFADRTPPLADLIGRPSEPAPSLLDVLTQPGCDSALALAYALAARYRDMVRVALAQLHEARVEIGGQRARIASLIGELRDSRRRP